MKELRDQITDRVKSKTSKLGDKTKTKVAKKCVKKCAKACAAFALLLAFAGCHMGEQPAAQRSQTSTITDNVFDIRVFTTTNAVYDAEGNPVAAIRIDIGNLAQANDTGGSETMTASPSNTPTVDVKPDIDVSAPVTKTPMGQAADAAGQLIGGLINGATQGGSSSTCPNAGGGCSGSDCELTPGDLK